MFPATLRRNIGHSTLQNFQQRLLNAFTGNIAGDGGVFAFAGDLIDLVNIDDAAFRQFHIEIRRLQKPQQDILDVIAHIAGFCQRSSVGNSERYLQYTGQRLGKQGFAAAGGTDHQNVAFLQLHILAAAKKDTFVVVIHRHGQGNFGCFLSHHILIQHGLDLMRCRNLVKAGRCLRLCVVSIIQK